MSESNQAQTGNPVWRFFTSTRFAALGGIIGPIIAFIGIFVSIAISGSWFNWYTNALSDLGHPSRLGGSSGIPGFNPAALLYNGSLIVTGLLTLPLTFWLIYHQRGESSILGMLAGIILFIAQLFLISVGIFHEEFGDLHGAVSVGFFVFILLAGMTYGIRLLLTPENRLFGIVAFGLPFISAIIWAVHILLPGVLPWTGVAIPEMISAIVSVGWVLPLAFRLYIESN